MHSHPNVDITFIIELLTSSNKVEKIHTQGSTTFYVLKGTQPIASRMIPIRSNNGTVDFEYATGLAIKLKKMSELLAWLKENRGYNHG